MGGDKGGEQQRWAAEMATAMARAGQRRARRRASGASEKSARLALPNHLSLGKVWGSDTYLGKSTVAARVLVGVSRSWYEVTAHHVGTRCAISRAVVFPR